MSLTSARVGTARVCMLSYIVKARLDRCCTLIEQGLPITEVYKTSGFGGYNHFFRAFKKEYGMTPKEYFHTTRQDARG